MRWSSETASFKSLPKYPSRKVISWSGGRISNVVRLAKACYYGKFSKVVFICGTNNLQRGNPKLKKQLQFCQCGCPANAGAGIVSKDFKNNLASIANLLPEVKFLVCEIFPRYDHGDCPVHGREYGFGTVITKVNAKLNDPNFLASKCTKGNVTVLKVYEKLRSRRNFKKDGYHLSPKGIEVLDEVLKSNGI